MEIRASPVSYHPTLNPDGSARTRAATGNTSNDAHGYFDVPSHGRYYLVGVAGSQLRPGDAPYTTVRGLEGLVTLGDQPPYSRGAPVVTQMNFVTHIPPTRRPPGKAAYTTCMCDLLEFGGPFREPGDTRPDRGVRCSTSWNYQGEAECSAAEPFSAESSCT